MSWEELRRACAAGGFDVFHSFDVGSWPGEPALPSFAVGGVIGNTRALWPHVRDACRRGEPDPVDDWTERTISRAASDAFGDAHAIVWAHHVEPAFPIQRLAQAVGLATLSPSRLAIHPDHGPWWALRAVVLAGGAPPPPSPAIDVCGPCDKPCVEPFERAQGSAEWRAWLAVRDACPVARERRYDDQQIVYHYENAFLSGR